MRVATALTGMTACAAGFLPTAAAQAAPSPGRPGNLAKINPGDAKRVRIPDQGTMSPDTTAPQKQPYWLNIYFKTSVRSYQVCGWHPGNEYRCTAWTKNFINAGSFKYASDVGGNKHSWDRGQITIGWNGGGPGLNDTCNTNGAYYGFARSGGTSNYWSVFLSAPNNGLIGNGVPEC